MTSRRAVLRGMAIALVAAPRAAGAQPPGTRYRIGFLMNTPPTTDPAAQRFVRAFVRALRETGWVEGQNAIIEWRYADGRMERFPDLAAELVRLKVDVIVTSGGVPPTHAARQATRRIPIVAIGLSDPVGQGFVASLARPGGNVTGFATLFPELAAKRLALLKETLPKVSRVAVLRNPANPGSIRIWEEVQVAGRALGVALSSGDVRDADELRGAFATMIRERAQGLLVLDDALFIRHRTPIVDLAAKHRVPAIYAFREHVEAGGLMAYGVNLSDLSRRAASTVDKILKGANPADLRVEQPTTFELFVNLKTAKALGLTVPPAVLARADQVIE